MAHSNLRSYYTGRNRCTVGGQNAGIYSASAKVWAIGSLPTGELGESEVILANALQGTKRG